MSNTQGEIHFSIHPDEVHSIVEARHGDPFRVLGPHPVSLDGAGRSGFAIRTFLPGAERVEAIIEQEAVKKILPLAKIDESGFFEGLLPAASMPRYWLRGHLPGGHSWVYEDPYRFPRVLGDLDLHLLGEGNHLRSFDKLGAHLIELEGVKGVHFALWAPNAQRVSVVGDFNGWDGRRHPMRHLGSSGIWEIFIPGLTEGDLYKFEIRAREGILRLKSDPYGCRFEFRPGTSTIVHDLGKHRWQDRAWLEARSRWNWLEAPLSIYEVHLGSWMRAPEEGNRYLTYRELAHRLPDYAHDLGFTHLQLLPVQEHPFDGSWGYQTSGYYAPTSRHGTPDDFMYFVDQCHQKGLGVLLDWVPAHFPRDDHGLRFFDGTCLYEHADPRRGEHRDWGTLIFNYGRNEVRNFLLANALYWLEKYHLDGLRVDAVASMLYLDYSRQDGDWIPNAYGGKENLEAIDFLKRFNELCHQHFPGVLTIAEESTAWTGVSRPTYLGGLGFSMKWNMGWMNDILGYFRLDPVHRKYHHQNLTFGLLYAFTENFILPLSHDEVVHGKCSLLDRMPGDAWQKFANLRLLLGFQYTHPGKKLVFQGGEFGQGQEWNSDQSLDWHLLDTDWHRGVHRFVRDLNRFYRTEPALHQVDFEWQGFEWIDFHDWESSLISFLRRGRNPGEEVIVILNFTPVPRGPYRVGVPSSGFYREVLNSDSTYYCGSGAGNLGGVQTEDIPSHGRPCSLSLTIPPLGMLILKRS